MMDVWQNKSQIEESQMANAGENQPYHDVEPIFNGSLIS